MATRKNSSKKSKLGVVLEGHPYPHGGLDYGKNHPNVPKMYTQQFKVDSTYYRLSGKPTLGLPMGTVEPAQVRSSKPKTKKTRKHSK